MTANVERHATTTLALRYEPLDKSKKSVRLLKILPESTEELIRCNLIHVDLDDDPAYVALSYMWDQGRGFKDLVCCGVTTQIGRNLWDFLIQFHKEDEMAGTRLWVDAICINQNDDSERGHQVMQMRDVYSKASLVIAWLGELEGHERQTFELSIDNPPPWTEEVNSFVSLLFRKPYWSRVWVIQEVILAQSLEIWCGPHRLDSSKLNPQHYMYRDTPAKEVLSKRQTWWQKSLPSLRARDFRLGSLLTLFETSKCSEPYDKVYGLLGLATNATDPRFPIIPDYTKPPVEVLIAVLRNHHMSYEEGDIKLNDFFLINTLQHTLGASHADLKDRLLNDYPDLKNRSALLTTGKLPLIVARLFTVGYLDVGIVSPRTWPDSDQYCFWTDSAVEFDETWHTEMKACAYFRKPSDR